MLSVKFSGFRFFSFQRQLTLVLVAIVSLFAIAIGVTSYLTFRGTLVREGMATTRLAADSAAKMVQNRISHQQDQALAFLESLELNCALSGDLNRSCARELISKYRQETGATGAVLNYRRSPLIAAGRHPESLPKDQVFAFSTDKKHYVLSARNQNTGARMQTLSSDGSLIDLLPQFGPRSSGVTFLLDPSGTPVTLGESIRSGNLNYAGLATVCRRDMHGEITVSDSEGRPALVAFRAMPPLNGSCLLAELHFDDVLLPAHRLRSTIVSITIAFLVIAVLLSFLMGRLLSQPLALLSRQIASMRNEGLQPQLINVDRGPVEVKHLADAFATTMQQLKTAQEALQESQARLRERERLEAAASMASLLAHEINNPLAALTNTAYLLRYGTVSEADRSHLLQLLSSDLDRISHIVRQILSLYQPNLRPEAIDLQHLLLSAVEELKPELIGKNAQLIVDVRPLPVIAGFSSELKTAISNLLLNALENVPPNGRTWIKANTVSYLYGHRSAIRILIGNDGEGITKEDRERLFEPFTSSQGQGRGLGLWVAQIVIRKHEGQVRIRSGSGGKGTFVQVVLPIRSYLQARVG